MNRSEPDLLVLDLALDRSDAIDVIRKLEVLKFPGAVMLLSGRDELTLRYIERIGTAHGLAMLPSLQKPFRAAEFKARLQEFAARAPNAVEGDRSRSTPVSAEDLHAILERALELPQPGLQGDVSYAIQCPAPPGNLQRLRHGPRSAG